MKIYIDNNGNLFGQSAYKEGMTLCELKEDGKPYVKYNLDGTPDLTKQAEVDKESLIASFKSAYLAEVDKVLAENDYDSLATVKLWADDADYGVEATSILTWYKAVIAKNYEILNSGTIPTMEEYLEQLPKYGETV